MLAQKGQEVNIRNIGGIYNMKAKEMFKYKNQIYKVIYGDLSASNKLSVLCEDIKNNIYVIYIDINLSEEERRKELHIVLNRQKELRELRCKDFKSVSENIESINFIRKLNNMKEKVESIDNIEENIIENFRKLNASGQVRVLELLEDLITLNKYRA
ncbi:hypothetical protein CYK87_09340 [Clostridium perfringens]|nr:hypothetical protein CYK87_09340 [Clostridium perfringens]